MILARLKQETRDQHDALERNPYAMSIMDGSITHERYRLMLERFYGFYRPLETRMAQFIYWNEAGLDFAARAKSARLEADLRFLGQTTPETLPLCSDLPPVDTLPAALGTMYVLEGATLGGQIIYRHLRAALGVEREAGCAFFSSYGDQLGMMWKAFTERVTTYSHLHHCAHDDAIVAAARLTYSTFDRWLMGGVLASVEGNAAERH